MSFFRSLFLIALAFTCAAAAPIPAPCTLPAEYSEYQFTGACVGPNVAHGTDCQSHVKCPDGPKLPVSGRLYCYDGKWYGALRGCRSCPAFVHPLVPAKAAVTDCGAATVTSGTKCDLTSYSCRNGGAPGVSSRMRCIDGRYVGVIAGCHGCDSTYTQDGYDVVCATMPCTATCSADAVGAATNSVRCVRSKWVGKFEGCTPKQRCRPFRKVGYIPSGGPCTAPWVDPATSCFSTCDGADGFVGASSGTVTCDAGQWVGGWSGCSRGDNRASQADMCSASDEFTVMQPSITGHNHRYRMEFRAREGRWWGVQVKVGTAPWVPVSDTGVGIAGDARVHVNDVSKRSAFIGNDGNVYVSKTDVATAGWVSSRLPTPSPGGVWRSVWLMDLAAGWSVVIYDGEQLQAAQLAVVPFVFSALGAPHRIPVPEPLLMQTASLVPLMYSHTARRVLFFAGKQLEISKLKNSHPACLRWQMYPVGTNSYLCINDASQQAVYLCTCPNNGADCICDTATPVVSVGGPDRIQHITVHSSSLASVVITTGPPGAVNPATRLFAADLDLTTKTLGAYVGIAAREESPAWFVHVDANSASQSATLVMRYRSDPGGVVEDGWFGAVVRNRGPCGPRPTGPTGFDFMVPVRARAAGYVPGYDHHIIALPRREDIVGVVSGAGVGVMVDKDGLASAAAVASLTNPSVLVGYDEGAWVAKQDGLHRLVSNADDKFRTLPGPLLYSVPAPIPAPPPTAAASAWVHANVWGVAIARPRSTSTYVLRGPAFAPSAALETVFEFPATAAVDGTVGVMCGGPYVLVRVTAEELLVYSYTSDAEGTFRVHESRMKLEYPPSFSPNLMDECAVASDDSHPVVVLSGRFVGLWRAVRRGSNAVVQHVKSSFGLPYRVATVRMNRLSESLVIVAASAGGVNVSADGFLSEKPVPALRYFASPRRPMGIVPKGDGVVVIDGDGHAVGVGGILAGRIKGTPVSVPHVNEKIRFRGLVEHAFERTPVPEVVAVGSEPCLTPAIAKSQYYALTSEGYVPTGTSVQPKGCANGHFSSLISGKYECNAGVWVQIAPLSGCETVGGGEAICACGDVTQIRSVSPLGTGGVPEGYTCTVTYEKEVWTRRCECTAPCYTTTPIPTRTLTPTGTLTPTPTPIRTPTRSLTYISAMETTLSPTGQYAPTATPTPSPTFSPMPVPPPPAPVPAPVL